MEERIAKLEKEVSELKTQIRQLEYNQRQRSPQVNPITQERYQKGVTTYQNTHKVRSSAHDQNIEKKDIPFNISEEVIGKYGLSVIATVMILTGIGILSYMTWNLIPDLAKAGMIFLFAILCAAAGLVAGRNNEFRIFKNTMIALSMAVIYANIIIMQWSWNLISEIVTVILIVVWCFAGAVISRFLSEKFYYFVSLTGLVMSTIISTGLIKYSASGMILFTTLFAAYICLSFLYNFEYQEKHPAFGYAGIAIFVVLATAYAVAGIDSITDITVTSENMYKIGMRYFLILFACIITFAGKYLWHSGKQKWNEITYSVLAAILPAGFLLLFTDDFCIGHLILTAIIFYTVFISGQNFAIFTTICATWYLSLIGICVNLFEIPCLYLVLILLLICGSYILFDKKSFRYLLCSLGIVSAVTTFIQANDIYFMSDPLSESKVYVILLLLIHTVVLLLQYQKRDKWVFSIYSVCFVIVFLSAGYLFSLMPEYREWSLDYYYTVNWDKYSLYLSAAILINMTSSLLKKKYFFIEHTWIDKIHAVLANIGLLIVFADTEQVILAAVILIQITYLVYVFDILKQSSPVYDIGYGIMVTINLSVLYFQSPLSDIAILYSVLMMIIAAGFILLGAYIKRKPLRLYGLILMFLSVGKMVLIDLQGESSWIKVVAFICGGIVCLAISYAYNFLEKELNTNTKTE